MLCRGSLQRGLRVAALGIALGAPLAPAADTIVFGPQTFTRASGGPVTVKRSFSVTTPSPARLHVTNAGVTNGVITLNGIGIIRPADFLDPSGAVERDDAVGHPGVG